MRIFFCIIVWMLACAAASASAQEVSDDDRARSHFAAGTSYFEQHRYPEAAQEFMEAYRLSHRGALLLDAASAYERLDDNAHAAETLQRYLDEQPDATDRATIESRLAVAREHVQEQEAAAAAGTPAPAPPPADDGIGTLGIAGISVAGVGVLAGIAAIITGVVALDTHSGLESRCGVGGTSCPAGYQSDVDLGNAMSVANTVLIPISLVALAAGVTMLVLDLTDGPSTPTSTTAAILPGPGDVGLSARIRF